MYECIIGLTCFITGVLLMYAVHRVVFDIYSDKAKNTIRKLRIENKALRDICNYSNNDVIQVEHIHTFATPDDVTNIKFWE